MVSDADNLIQLAEIMRQFGFYEFVDENIKGAYHRVISTTLGMTLEPANVPPCRPGEWVLAVRYFEKETPAMAMDEGVVNLYHHVGDLGSCLIHSVRFTDIAIGAAKEAVKKRTDPTAPGLPEFGSLLRGLKP